jgi:hypothetical protein
MASKRTKVCLPVAEKAGTVYQDVKIVPEVVKNYQLDQEVNSLQVIAMNALA